MTFLRCILPLILLLWHLPYYGNAQLTCTLSGAKDANDCMAITDDNEHCVWCSLDKQNTAVKKIMIKEFGFCVSEVQAEAMEKNIPLLHCHRYSSTDDGVTPPTTDDAATDDDGNKPEPNIDDDISPPTTDDVAPPATDDVAPTTDDITPPATDDVTPPATDDVTPETDDKTPPSTDDVTPSNDDDNNVIPDDFWTCLQQKTSTTCTHANCTWCDTKGGFSLCMTGPTAESASHSAWFHCHERNYTIIDVVKTTLVSERSTTTTTTMTTTIEKEYEEELEEMKLDMSCVENFVEHPTANECMTTMDSTGHPCQWCTIMDLMTMCLSSEQVAMGNGLGLSCENPGFTNDANSEVVLHASMSENPYDPSCLLAYLEDSSSSTCVSTIDANGIACEYCTLQGQFNLCLTQEQATMGEEFGVTCDSNDSVVTVKDDPYDPSCLLAYLQDPTQDGCTAAVDDDGTPCEFCNLQGAFNVCLTMEQASMGEQFGITCDANLSSATMIMNENVNDDPYDPSCLLAYLQDPSKDACVSAMDEDNNPCEFCNLQGAFAVCLTAEQAAMGEQFGVTCDDKNVIGEDPYDSSCLIAFWSDQSESTCSSTMDTSVNLCEYCSLPGSFVICLTSEQAQIGQTLGMECTSGSRSIMNAEGINDPLDTSCALSYLQTPTKDACTATMDADGTPCEFCNLQNTEYSICLNQEQAQIGQQLGFDCDSSTAADLVFPDDFFECLQNYQEGDCRSSSCTWCNTQVGIGFCLAPAAAEATKQCTFFDCEFDQGSKSESKLDDIYDPVCLEAGIPVNSDDDTAAICASTNGTDGNPCVWCDASGVFGLCLSAEQATAAGQFLQCDVTAIAVAL